MVTRQDILDLGFEDVNKVITEIFSVDFINKDKNLLLRWIIATKEINIITRDPSLNEEYMRTNVDPNERTFTPKDVKELKEMLNISTKE